MPAIYLCPPLNRPESYALPRYTDNDMAGRHRSRNRSIQVIKTAVVAPKDCKRDSTLQFHVSFTPSPSRLCVLLLLAYMHIYMHNWMLTSACFLHRTLRSNSPCPTASCAPRQSLCAPSSPPCEETPTSTKLYDCSYIVVV